MAPAELARHFLPDEEPAHRRRDDAVKSQALNLLHQLAAKALRQLGMLEKQGALKELPAMLPRPENKVPFQKGSSFAESVENLLFVHDQATT